MKKIFFIVILSLFHISLLAQFDEEKDTSAICKSFEQGIEQIKKENLSKALQIWIEITKQTKEDASACFTKSYKYIPYLYLEMKDTTNAILWAKKSLAYPLKNNFLGMENIMEPFLNVHYFNAALIADIAQNRNDFKTSLAYLDSMETKYKYKAFSGTSWEKWAVSRAMWRSNLYTKIKDEKNALFCLVQKVLDRDMFYQEEYMSVTNIPFYTKLNEKLIPMIEKQYGKEKFRKKLDSALEKMVLQPEDKNGRKLQKATFKLFNKEMWLGISSEKKTKEKLIQELKSTEFYQKLKEN